MNDCRIIQPNLKVGGSYLKNYRLICHLKDFNQLKKAHEKIQENGNYTITAYSISLKSDSHLLKKIVLIASMKAL